MAFFVLGSPSGIRSTVVHEELEENDFFMPRYQRFNPHLAVTTMKMITTTIMIIVIMMIITLIRIRIVTICSNDNEHNTDDNTNSNDI